MSQEERIRSGPKKPRDPTALLRSAGKLKTIKRTGWIRKAGILENAESVADHSFRMAIIGAYLSEVERLDSSRVIRMCLFHDLAESEIGDLTPEEKVSEQDHRKMEDSEIMKIFVDLPEKIRKKFLRDWKDLLQNESKEARLVWKIDKLEMGLQMKDYLARGVDRKKLAEFDPSGALPTRLEKIFKSYSG
ncbi:MAG: HD domain-containing protein [Nitrososphaerales archaeon]